MKYEVRKAVMEDLPRILEIYAYAREFMARNGNPTQWGTTHPPREILVQDILEGELFAVTAGDEIHGVFFFRLGEDPTYAEIFDGSWHSNSPYGTIHRIAGDGSHGILRRAVEFAEGQTDHIRIDTHADNHVMQRAVEKVGFRRCGIIYIADGSPRIAYDKIG